MNMRNFDSSIQILCPPAGYMGSLVIERCIQNTLSCFQSHNLPVFRVIPVRARYSIPFAVRFSSSWPKMHAPEVSLLHVGKDMATIQAVSL